ncbi:MAG: glycine--tRNA ligase subunit beta [Rickettsiales bacterium]
MPDFLLELFSEEIPARMQVAAINYLQDSLIKELKVVDIEPFSTPRRLAVIIKNLPITQPDITTELKGPKIDAPEVALNGFLKKNNLTLEQLEKRDGVYFASNFQKGKPTAEILKPIIEEILAKFPWPKSMRWGSGSVNWVRPLQSILCIFDGQIVPVEFAGIKAGNITYGHRFLAPDAITINKPEEYELALEKAYVIADRDKRKDEVFKQAEAVSAAHNLTVKKDDYLLEEVVGLVEYPQVLLGKIDDKFMDLPPEVLTMVMRSHQKYFALQNSDGSLSSGFLITSNMKTDDVGKAIIAGNERVLRARFADGRFFWDTDRKKPLSQWAEGLKTVTYHAKLGSVADKVERIKALALALADYVPNADKELVARAAELCKADLVTGMVGEFAELQGIMGRYYALQQGENQAVADAIRDHYKPVGAGDNVPTVPVSICVALADKLDTLISMFAIGEKPTGSKDPFALRRAVIGVIRIILDNELRLSLSLVIPAKAVSQSGLLAFFHDRLKVQLKDSGIRHDVIDAVITGDDDLVRIVARAKALQEFLQTENGANLLAAYKRAANIVAIEEKKDKISYKLEKLDISALKEPEEIKLAGLLDSLAVELISLKNNEKFTEAMDSLARLRQPLDLFFDKIMVNCEDEILRTARLGLLSALKDIMDSIANFVQIEG